MDTMDVLNHLTAAGVRLSPTDDGNLRAEPRNALSDEVRALIRTHKGELLALLADRESFEERAAIREYDASFERGDAEFLAAWELTQALFQRLTAREYLARYAQSRLPAGDSADNYPVARLPPGNDFWLERQRRGGGL